jgi:lysophospholipase L1-like esterase
MRTLASGLQVVNYACPGESTKTFIAGGCPGRGDVKGLHDTYKGAQLTAALVFLRAHSGKVGPITLTLWGNDLFEDFAPTCNGDLVCVKSHARAGLARLATRLTTIVSRLRTAAPTAEIILTGAWNFDVEQYAQADPLFRSIDATIARVAALGRARVAKMYPVFDPAGSLAVKKARICKLTFICTKGDPHPTDAGYRAMAGAFWAASGY